ncbi:MAG TPA: trypsin-like peptidase domain-containing protein [Acetivibrio sp.]|nr:trypsin-like peptidase domain-containing protein [Acetivibrio sp.]
MEDNNYNGLNNYDEIINEQKDNGTVELNNDTGTNNTDNSYSSDVSSGMENTQNYENAYGTKKESETVNKDLSSSPYYTESCKKPKKEKKGVLLQMIVVALMSSIIGGSVVGSFFMFGIPALKSPVQSILGNGAVTGNDPDVSKNESDIYRKVVIESADSPVVAIAEKVGPSVVGISVKSTSVNDFWFFSPSESEEQGSGIIIRSDGYIMTNNHVIEKALSGTTNNLVQNAKIQVILPSNPDKPYDATVVGRDTKTDLAVLKIDASSLPAVEFGNSDDVKVGELAVAIGNPGGLEYMGSVTVGVISGLNRTIPITDDKELKLIQTDASINPGNSGGALVNAEGKLIGVNTAKIGGIDFEGLGFAIPVNKAKEITDSLIEFKYVKGRPSLGIQVNTGFTKEVADRFGIPEGILVYKVEIFSAAYKADIQEDDVITEFNGVRVKNYDELEEQKSKFKPGDTVKIKIYRYHQEGKGEELTVDVVMDEQK